MLSPRSRAYLGLGILAAATIGFALVGDLRAHTYLYLALYAAAAAGYVLAVGALRTLPLPVIVAAGLALRVILLPGEPSLSDDYHRYLWDGMVQQEGVNPYLYAPTSPRLDSVDYPDRDLINHPDQRTLYPALAEHSFHGLALLGARSAGALKAAFGLFDLMVAALLAFGAGARRREALGLYLLHPMILLETWSSAHFEAVPVALMVLAALLITRARDVGGGLALGLAAALKVYPALLLVPALLGRRARPVPLLVGFALGVGAPYLPFLRQGAALGSLAETGATPEFHSSVFFLLNQAFSYGTTRILVAALFIVGAVVLARRRPGRSRTAQVFAWTATLLMLLSPVVHPWYWFGPIALAILGGVRLPVFLGLAAPASYVTYAQTPFRQRLWARVLSYLPLVAPSTDLKAVAKETKTT